MSVNLHPLNAADRLMLVAHEGLRKLGHSGFCCQSHVWLNGPVEIEHLNGALARLAGRHPVVVSRIEHTGAAVWHHRENSSPFVRVHSLTDDAESSILRQAENLLTEECDLSAVDPIAFHVLRRPCAKNVLVLQWNHALMDGKAPELALMELNRVAKTPAPENVDSCRDDAGNIGSVLHCHSKWRRCIASSRIIASHVRPPARSITLEPPRKPEWVFKPIRIAVRMLDAAATAALGDRVKRTCGLLNLTPAVLASVYRVIARITPRKISSRSVFRTDVPLNLRSPSASGPIFRNFMSFISLHAKQDELHSRDELTLLLHRRMREQLARGSDIGNLALMEWLSRQPGLMHEHLLGRMQKHPLTLGFGFLGPLSAGLNNILGVPIERFYTLNTAMSPPGLTLQVNLSRERLNLAATYIEAVVPESLASAFLDGVIDDLMID